MGEQHRKACQSQGGGGYSDIFTHTLARPIFFGSNHVFQYFSGFSEK